LLSSIIFTLVFIAFIFLIHQDESDPSPVLPARPGRDLFEAGLLIAFLLIVRYIDIDLLKLSGRLSAYLIFLLGLLAPMAIEWGIRRRSLSAIGFRMPTDRETLILVAILFIFYLVVRVVLPPILGQPLNFNFQDFIANTVIYAFLEEVIFRGMIQTRFEAALGRVRAWVLSGLFFGFYHYYVHFLVVGKSLEVTGVLELVFLTAFGMLLGLIYSRTKSLLPSYLIHAINNLSLFSL
jgi:membrane protease YdiL (CAAX protease family)